MNTYTLTEFDAAVDFAYGYRNSIAFCAKMVRTFEVYGTLTPGQVRALLSMRAARRAS